jgi:hypothetical protein
MAAEAARALGCENGPETAAPGPWSSCSATEGTNGSPPASKTSTTATSTASRPPSANTPRRKASCKTIVGQRLKQAGMHWTVAGARRHHRPALQRGQQPAGSHLQPPSQPDRSRLICPCPELITLEHGLPPAALSQPLGNQVKAAKTQAWRLQVAPACHQAVAACVTCPGPGGRSGGVADAGGWVSEAMHAVSRRRI